MKEKRLKNFLLNFNGKRVLVIGDVILDEYIWGDVNRISPEAPVPVVEVNERSYHPGGAANTASNVAALSGKALVGGVAGKDIQADILRQALKEKGVDVTGIVADKYRPTTTKTRIVAHNQQMVRVDHEQTASLPDQVERELLAWAKKQLKKADSCIISDYEKGVISETLSQEVIREAKKLGKPVIVDPKGKNFAKYRGATVIKPNQLEAELAINHKIKTEDDLMEAARKLMRIVEGSTLLITRGAKGMSLFLQEDLVIHVPANTRNVFDVTGAGDTVVSVLALALACGADMEDSARLANRAAGIVVGKVGTATVSVEEILAS